MFFFYFNKPEYCSTYFAFAQSKLNKLLNKLTKHPFSAKQKENLKSNI